MSLVEPQVYETMEPEQELLFDVDLDSLEGLVKVSTQDLKDKDKDSVLDDTIHFSYDQDTQLLGGAYSEQTPDYAGFFEDSSDAYLGKGERRAEENDTDIMSADEVKEMVEKIQFAHVTGRISYEIDFDKRRKFAMHSDLHPEEIRLYHSLHALTDNVNYSNSF